MGGNNLESMLFAGDDSSSGESDSEAVSSTNAWNPAASSASVTATAGSTNGGTAAATDTSSTSSSSKPNSASPALASQAQSSQSNQQQQQQQQSSVGVFSSSSSATGTNSSTVPSSTSAGITSQSEMAARLKSMYSPATKSNQQAKQQQQQQPPNAPGSFPQPSASLPAPASTQQQTPAISGSAPPSSHSHHLQQHSQNTQHPHQGKQPLTKPHMVAPVPGQSPLQSQYHRSNSSSSGQYPTTGGSSQPGSSQHSQQNMGPPSSSLHQSGNPATGYRSMPQQPTQQQQQPSHHQYQSLSHRSSTQIPGKPSSVTNPPSLRGTSQTATSGSGTSGPGPSTLSSLDPYEPTPVSKIIERSKQQQIQQQMHQQQAQQQQQRAINNMSGNAPGPTAMYPHQPPASGTVPSPQHASMSMSTLGGSAAPAPGSTRPPVGVPTTVASSGTTSGSSSTMSRADKEREMKKYKERFLIFTRVLMKYLEQKDANLHQKVKAIIKDCAERNKQQEPGYESVTVAMRVHLQAVVPENYWKRAEQYLDHFLKGKAKSGSASAAALTPSSTASLGTGLSGSIPNLVSSSSSSSTKYNIASSAPQQNTSSLSMSTDRMRMHQHQAQQGQSSLQQPPPQGQPHITSSPQQPAPAVQVPAMAQQQQSDKTRPPPGKVMSHTPSVPPTSSTLPQPPTSTSTIETPLPISVASTNVAAKKVAKGRGSKAASTAQARKTSIGSLPGTLGAGTGPITQSITGAPTDSMTAMPPASTDGNTSASMHIPMAVTTSTTTPVGTTPLMGTTMAPPALMPQMPTKVTPPPPPPPREYSEFMELVENAVNYDWTVAGLLMDNDQPAMLSTEQKSLLEETLRTGPSSTVTLTNKDIDGSRTPFPIPGWGKRNVLSARSAWALVRLNEEAHFNTIKTNPNPVVGNGLLSLPPPAPTAFSNTSYRQVTSPIRGEFGMQQHYAYTWYNNEKAEEDKVLALISEGLQIYLKGVMEKAVHCARQRYNVDGIRLWHQQTSLALKAKQSAKDNKKDASSFTTVTSTGAGAADNGLSVTPPPLILRLGCDVTRQIAQAAGNAAMTVKRMEEALERQPHLRSYDRFTAETESTCLLRAASMSDVALLPQLGNAVEQADLCGKRSFEIFGGKNSSDPPFGRVPKQFKLELVDFQMGMNFIKRGGKRRSRAGTMSSSFFY